MALSACSSSSSSADNKSAGAPASSGSTATGTPIKIGVISTDSGNTGTSDDVPDTVKQWQAFVNAHGGISGRRVEVTEIDDGGNPAQALQGFNTLKSEGAVAI